MDRWTDKAAIVTGASAGIGAAIAKALVERGVTVVGVARRIEKIEELSENLADAPGKLYAVRCDVTKEEEILSAFEWVANHVGPIHILVNNAGLSRPSYLTDGASEDWRYVLEVNVMALCICTREAVKNMKENGVAGHIVHINSVVGHYVPNLPKPDFNVYPATKHAVTALTESLRQELRSQGSAIKVTSISPGVVKTGATECLAVDGATAGAKPFPMLEAGDVAEAVVYVLSTGVNVHIFSENMDRWTDKVAIVTGASAGIGAAISKALVEKGLNVVGIARRIEKIEELSKSLVDAPGKLYAVRCDVTKEEDILRMFKWVTDHVGPVHILINNAGLTRPTHLIDGATEEWRRVFEVNVMALCICTREAVKIMKENDIAGHIVHMNSVVGHYVPNLPKPNFNVYPASKFAVTALTESLRQELRYHESGIKVTSISPGVVKTEFADGFPEDGTKEAIESFPILKPEDIAEAVIYVLSTGPSVHVQELTIRPLGEMF
ncbi:hypothetical protein NQ315_007390 [Exocentrus adspersus]|uniref:Dehydrogenase/reductase SDR family member 11 n=1 Tax=Exocentrus adspersus TaxID=1586481 RepID=A0AAV8VHI3_9CUCU|nr:hypothetical protein NQ315_007390 [Exocentrus adspersus]